MPVILQSDELCFNYGNRMVFENFSFAVQKGDMVALLGANGAGKTTLLSMIAGLLRPTSGRMLVNGQELTNWKRRELSRFVALVPQHLDLPFSFTVEEIVSQGRVPHLGRFGSLLPRDRDVVRRAMEAVDVVALRDRVFSELSGGERQRVKIAIGLAQEPKLMLLDEPTQHLDIGRQVELVTLLRQLNESGITIMAAVHDLSVARENFSKALLLMNANAVSGPVEDVMRPDLLQHAFTVHASTFRAFGPESPSVPAVSNPCRHTSLGARNKRNRRSLPPPAR